jgi:glycosyltransferase involved in cell wall biosynthesis
MRIAVWHNLPSGGGKRALLYHLKALVDRGHQLEIWCPDTAYSSNLHAVEKDIKLHVLPLKEELQKLTPPQKYYHKFSYLKKRNIIIKRHCEEVAKQVSKSPFDLAFVNSCAINYMSFMGLSILKIPSVIYLGEPYRFNYEASPNLVWTAPGDTLSSSFIKNHISILGNRLQVFEEIQAAKSYSKILVNSLYSREAIMKCYGMDSEVCYLGIDNSFLEFSLKPKKPYVISLGYFYYYKGVDRAIRTISNISSNVRPKLLWVGNGVDELYKVEMTDLSRKLNVELEILINVTDDELKLLIAEAALMVYMPRLEPFGFAPLEANALGTTVVAIAEGGIRETIKHGINGFLVQNEDFITASKYVEALVTDLCFASVEGEKSRMEVKENWGFNKLSDNIERSLSSVQL